MKEIPAGKVILSLEEAESLARRVLTRAGYEAEEAKIIADHVIDAALCGYEYSGLAKILNVVEHQRFKLPRHPLKVLTETPVSALFDGGNNNGMLAMYRLTEIAIEKASAHGISIVGMNNTWMSGRSAYFVEMVARAGMVGIHTVSSFPHVVPPGGRDPVLGTNPIAFGFPTEKEPLIIDMSTSAFPGTELLYYQRKGQLLPPGVAVDKEGEPTQDPGLAHGFFPFGGYKGFAIGLAMQALGVLAGSGKDMLKAYGHLMIAIKPGMLLPEEEFRRDMSQMISRIKSVRPQPDVKEIRIPSERSFRERERRRKEGIEVDKAILEALSKIG